MTLKRWLFLKKTWKQSVDFWEEAYAPYREPVNKQSKLAKKKNGKGKKKTDVAQYTRDCRKFSIDHGTNTHIARARESLKSMEGGIDLLKSLVSFDPDSRFTALDAMNSVFMEPLREPSGQLYGPEDDVRTYTIALN